MNMVKTAGVVLLAIAVVHFLGVPWGLVLSAGVACIYLES